MPDWKTIRPLLLTALATAALGLAGAYAFVKSGVYDVAASSPHTKFTEWITHETMIHSARSHARGVRAPASVSAVEVRRGFCSYETHCVACHGAPAVARERWVSGMEPSPPYLLDSTHRWKPQELFWIAKSGIKMTGMPSWRNAMSDREIWDVVAFLEAMGRLNPQIYGKWREAGFCPAVSRQPVPGPHSIPHP